MVDESAIFEAPKLPASHWPALVATTWISGDAYSRAKLSSIDHIQWLITFITQQMAIQSGSYRCNFLEYSGCIDGYKMDMIYGCPTGTSMRMMYG